MPAFEPDRAAVGGGGIHKHLTHNKTYTTYRQFAETTLDFLRKKKSQRLAGISTFRHRQFPHHQPKGFPGSGVNGAYMDILYTDLLKRSSGSAGKYATCLCLVLHANITHHGLVQSFMMVMQSIMHHTGTSLPSFALPAARAIWRRSLRAEGLKDQSGSFDVRTRVTCVPFNPQTYIPCTSWRRGRPHWGATPVP